MKKTLTALTFLLSFCLQIVAQTSNQPFFCSTPPEKSEWLTKFQENPEAYPKSDEVLYIPLTVHLVGSNDGDAYLPFQMLLDEICSLNTTFEPTDIQFFLEGEVRYINNSGWYVNSEVDMMNAYNVANTVNCYFSGNENGSFFNADGDGLVVSKGTLPFISSLWEHELGHYFSLPHTFWGWELSNYYNYTVPAPATIGGRAVERVDGTNCTTAGDGFCDTPPDYLWFFDWLCLSDMTSNILQTDPAGTSFRTDGSLIMTYSTCADRFSDMQTEAIRANILDVRPNLLYNQNPLDDINTTVELLRPEPEAEISTDVPHLLEWNGAPNATHYLVHLTFLPYFSKVYDEYIVTDTFLQINNLSPNKQYRWRVRPYNAFYTCAPFSTESIFSTGTLNDCNRSTVIGTTTYDNQSNASVCNRISEDSDGNVMATWTQSFDQTGSFPDRGTGYNRFDAASGTWGAIPSARLEAGIRTGWPNHIVTENGTELIVNHVFTNQGVSLHSFRRTPGNTAWIENQIPTNTPRGMMLARMVASGETVHLIAISTPVSFGGVTYQGVDMHLLYYRSSDAGANWEVIDQIIPGTDNTFVKTLGFLDCYSIDARDNVVAIGLFSQINDVRIFKSEDNGDTWVNTLMHDFPLSHYQVDQGYTSADLPTPGPQQPDPLAILTTDNSGNVLVDKNGIVHAFYGQMYFKDNTVNDGYTLFYDTDGIAYWNESFGIDSTRVIANIADLDGNGNIDVESKITLGTYSLSMTSTPSPGVDENNNIYLAYSMIMEGPTYRQNEEGQQYRHIMLIHSQDGGETWSAPFNATEAVCISASDFLPFTEAMFPSMVRDIKDEIRFIYQQDFDPGNISNGFDPPVTNYIRFAQLDINELGVVQQEESIKPEAMQLDLYPNPAGDYIMIVGKELVQLAIYDLAGRIVMAQRLNNGQNQIDVSNLVSGVYWFRIKTGEGVVVRRVVKG